MKQSDFIGKVNGWSNHRPLLYKALQETSGDVYEFGCGDGSTEVLRKYCKAKKRELRSFESNKSWAEKFKAEHVANWGNVELKKIGVLFVDHAPGERRKTDCIRWKDHADIIVMHDTEPNGAGAIGYRFDLVWPHFKYVVHIKHDGAWVSAASNTIDLTKWKKVAGYEISSHL